MSTILKQKRVRIIILLAIIAGFLLGLKIIFKNKIEPIQTTSPVPTAVIPSTQIPNINEKGDLDAPIQIRKEIQQDYPLFQYIPYKTQNWQIDYLKPLILEVILKADSPAIRQEVLDWITSKKVDPATHKIIWKTSF